MELKGENGLFSIVAGSQERPDSLDEWDASWWSCRIKMLNPAFDVSVGCNLSSIELKGLAGGLMEFVSSSSNEMSFDAMEESLFMKAKRRQNSQVILTIRIKDTWNDLGYYEIEFIPYHDSLLQFIGDLGRFAES